MDTREVDYAVPSMYPTPPSNRSKGLFISTIALAVALLLSLVSGAFIVSGIQGDLDSTRKTLTTSQDNLEDAEATVADTEEQLVDANAKATACAEAADLLAKGANGYADLWNGMDDAADEFRILFAFYVRSIMRSTNVPNATLNAGWDALDACEAGGGGSGIDSL